MNFKNRFDLSPEKKINLKENTQKITPKDDFLLEELLKGTHGGSLYHWTADGF